MKSILPILMGVLVPLYCFGQDCSIVLKGNVTDYHDKTPLAGATIQVLGINAYVVSDIDGYYSITGLCPGSIELEVNHVNCPTTVFDVEINGDMTLDLKLEHHLEELNEVEVLGSTTPKATISAQEVILKEQKLEQYSVGNLGEALREISGVSSLNTGANIVKPIIHGLSGSRVLILNDGVRMQDMEWGDEHAPNIDINSAGTIRVVKGASALKYGGDAIGGIILLDQPKLFAKDTLFGKNLINMVSNGRGSNLATDLTKANKNGWFIKVQASNKRLGDQEAPDYVLSNTGVHQIGASINFGNQKFVRGWDARYSYYDAEIAILRASHIGNVDDLIRAINSGEPSIVDPFTYALQNPKQKVRHHLGKLLAYQRFEGLGKVDLQYDFQNNRRLEFDIRRGDRDAIPAMDLELTTHTLGTNFTWDAKQNLKADFGLMGRYQNNFANPDTGVRRLIPDYDKYDFGTYAVGEYQLGSYWIFDAGVRYDFTQIDAQKFYITTRWEERGYDEEFEDLIIDDRGTQLLVNPVFDYNNISATVGGQYAQDEYLFRFNYALSARAPNPSELFSDGLHHSAARIELGDLRITSETSHKFSASLEKYTNRLSFSLAPYINLIDDFILLEPSGVQLTNRGAFPEWSYLQTDVQLLGVDATATVDWLKTLTTQHQFSLVKGKDLDRDLPLINIPSANLRNSITLQKPGWNNFELAINNNYVFEQNETPPNLMVFSPQEEEDVELAINDAPKAYHIIGLNTRLRFSIKGKASLATSLTITNLFNTNYREYLNRQRYFADDLGRNFILQLKFNY